MNRIFSAIFGGRLQNLLVASFVLVAMVTAVLSTVVISRVINDYLTSGEWPAEISRIFAQQANARQSA